MAVAEGENGVGGAELRPSILCLPTPGVCIQEAGLVCRRDSADQDTHDPRENGSDHAE